MLQTRRQAVRLLQRPCSHQLRAYADTGHHASNDYLTTGRPPADAQTEGHAHHPARTSHHPAPENEHMGRGFYLAIALLFGSLAAYKLNRTEDKSGEVSQQPLITRLLHYFDYIGEENAIRNHLFTEMIQQAGHDKTLFAASNRDQLPEMMSAHVHFNTGAPWNVPAGSVANLDQLREHYRKANIELEEERVARMDRMARRAAARGKTEQEQFWDTLGFGKKKAEEVKNKAEEVVSKVSKGE